MNFGVNRNSNLSCAAPNNEKEGNNCTQSDVKKENR